MKKTITILAILALLTALCIWDAVYINKVMHTTLQKTQHIIQLLDDDPQNINTQTNLQAVEELTDYWESKVGGMRFFASHIQVFALSEKVSSLKSYVQLNDYNMASSCAITIVCASEAAIDQNTPYLHNIF